jgi:hypothetical protein
MVGSGVPCRKVSSAKVSSRASCISAARLKGPLQGDREEQWPEWIALPHPDAPHSGPLRQVDCYTPLVLEEVAVPAIGPCHNRS